MGKEKNEHFWFLNTFDTFEGFEKVHDTSTLVPAHYTYLTLETFINHFRTAKSVKYFQEFKNTRPNFEFYYKMKTK